MPAVRPPTLTKTRNPTERGEDDVKHTYIYIYIYTYIHTCTHTHTQLAICCFCQLAALKRSCESCVANLAETVTVRHMLSQTAHAISTVSINMPLWSLEALPPPRCKTHPFLWQCNLRRHTLLIPSSSIDLYHAVSNVASPVCPRHGPHLFLILCSR